jgi:glucoamylase
MLPEQIWDRADLPSAGMYLGRSAGSAQPLVWAHAEYLKLLRSVSDGQVYDRISVVADRYAVKASKRTFTSQLEIYQTGRPISRITAGHSLRILDHDHFRVIYTFDNWATTLSLDSRSVGYPGSVADIATDVEQTGTIVFTLVWVGQDLQDRWLGRNVEVSVVPRG